MSELWRDWVLDPPMREGLDVVEAHRPSGAASWDKPQIIKISDLPGWFNVYGLKWRRLSPGQETRG
jgi:hypothetical protein